MPRIAVVIGDYPEAEFRRRRDTILSYAGGDLTVGLVRIAPSPYVPGFGSQGAADLAPAFVDGFRRAEAEGFDAVTPLGTLDIGVQAGRGAVHIPVVGALEASLHVAALLGRRAGLIAYSSNLIPPLQASVERLGLGGGVAGYGHVGIELIGLADAGSRLESAFAAAARELIHRCRADVIVSAGISLCPLHIRKPALERLLGLPVVEAIGAPIQVAAALVRLGVGAK